MIPAELRRRPAQIQFLDVVTAREYDLVCIGSPHMVAVDGRSGPLVPGVRCREPPLCAGREAIRRRRPLPPVLASQPEDSAETRNRARRCLLRRHSLPLRRRPGPLAPVADQLPRVGRAPRALSRGQTTDHQHPGLPPGGGSEVRGRAGRPSAGGHRRASIAGRKGTGGACRSSGRPALAGHVHAAVHSAPSEPQRGKFTP
jgi:hypothetical protein